jgi:hypothetical protein
MGRVFQLDKPTVRRPGEWSKRGTPEEARLGLKKILRATQEPAFHHDVNTQTWAITFLQELGSAIPSSDLEGLKTSVAQGINISAERLDYILGLDEIRHIRAALKVQYVERGPRLAHESVYPTSGWLGAFLDYAQEASTPMAFQFWTAVAILGAAARRNVYTQMGRYSLFPNHYNILVGPSGIGKSDAIKHTDMLQEAGVMLDQQVMDQAKEQVRDPNDPIEDCRVVVLPKQVTPEQMIKLLSPGSRDLGMPEDPEATLDRTLAKVVRKESVGFLVNGELNTLIGKGVHGATELIHLVTEFYNCEEAWEKGTVGRGLDKLRKMALTLVGASTLDWINVSISQDMFLGGFMSRVLYIQRPDKIAERQYTRRAPPLDPVQREILTKGLVPWMSMKQIECEFSEKAEVAWSLFIKDNEKLKRNPEDPKMAPYYERRENHLAKLAMVLAMSERLGQEKSEEVTAAMMEGPGSLDLSIDIIDMALEILLHEEEFLPACFERIGEHKEATALHKMIDCVGTFNKRTGRPITKAALGNKARSLVGLDWPKYLEEGIRGGQLTHFMQPSKRGRPTMLIWVEGKISELYDPRPKDP